MIDSYLRGGLDRLAEPKALARSLPLNTINHLIAPRPLSGSPNCACMVMSCACFALLITPQPWLGYG